MKFVGTDRDIRLPNDATLKQRGLIRQLCRDRQVDPTVRQRIFRQVDTYSRTTASETIDWLLKQPKT